MQDLAGKFSAHKKTGAAEIPFIRRPRALGGAIVLSLTRRHYDSKPDGMPYRHRVSSNFPSGFHIEIAVGQGRSEFLGGGIQSQNTPHP